LPTKGHIPDSHLQKKGGVLTAHDHRTNNSNITIRAMARRPYNCYINICYTNL